MPFLFFYVDKTKKLCYTNLCEANLIKCKDGGITFLFLPIIIFIEFVKMQISNKNGVGLSLLFCWLRKPEVCVWVRWLRLTHFFYGRINYGTVSKITIGIK